TAAAATTAASGATGRGPSRGWPCSPTATAPARRVTPPTPPRPAASVLPRSSWFSPTRGTLPATPVGAPARTPAASALASETAACACSRRGPTRPSGGPRVLPAAERRLLSETARAFTGANHATETRSGLAASGAAASGLHQGHG